MSASYTCSTILLERTQREIGKVGYYILGITVCIVFSRVEVWHQHYQNLVFIFHWSNL